MSHELNDQEIVRREKLQKLNELGIDAYPAAAFEVNCNSQQILSEYNDTEKNFQSVSIAGRIMSINSKGKVTFFKIQDQAGKIQLFVSIDNVCPGEDKTFYNSVVTHLLDIGDFIGVKGEVFITKTGETSIRVKEMTVLSKALRPLPVVKVKDGETFDAFSDVELRSRQRYVDLVVNPHVRETFLKRTKMIQTIRDFLNEHGAIEVDTPVLQSIPGGAAARPFVTHHNALNIPLYLRIANELYLKRLIVGGFDFVYEFSRNFRNEGIDRTHNPEFTVLEFYVAYKDYFWMMDYTETMMERIAISLHGTTDVRVGDKIISFKAPFKRMSMFDAIKEHTNIDIEKAYNISSDDITNELYLGNALTPEIATFMIRERRLREICQNLNVAIEDSIGPGKIIDEIFSAKCEKYFIQPTFIIDYPVEMSPLTKEHRTKKGLVERFELMINGSEIANAYSELNNPEDQRMRFEEQAKLMERGDDEAMFIDNDFLRSLEYGMPPTSGIGIGIDRLAMLMTNNDSIQEVLFFPQMRPEEWPFSYFVKDFVRVFREMSGKEYNLPWYRTFYNIDSNNGLVYLRGMAPEIANRQVYISYEYPRIKIIAISGDIASTMNGEYVHSVEEGKERDWKFNEPKFNGYFTRSELTKELFKVLHLQN